MKEDYDEAYLTEYVKCVWLERPESTDAQAVWDAAEQLTAMAMRIAYAAGHADGYDRAHDEALRQKVREAREFLAAHED